MSKTAILLVNLGSPSEPSTKAIRRFLREFLSDSRVVDLPRVAWLPILYGVILPFRPQKLLAQYQAIFQNNVSPLVGVTTQLAEQLSRHVNSETMVIPVMRYGEPSLRKVLDMLASSHIDKLTVLPLYPQFNASTTASVFDCVTSALREWSSVPTTQFISQYYQHDAYIDGLVQSVEAFWQEHGRSELLLFSFHGVPVKMIENGDPYLEHCRATVRRVTEQLGLADRDWRLVFQSRFGKAAWLTPYCDETLAQLPGQGHPHVDVICPGFAADCLETLYEIDVENREVFMAAGGQQFRYIPALGATELHTNALLQILQDADISITLNDWVTTDV